MRHPGRTAAATAGLVGLALLGLPLLGLPFLGITGGGSNDFGSTGGCQLDTDAGRTVNLDAEQLTNAGTVVAVAHTMRLPDRAAVIGLATALQESRLRSLTQAQSDRDSAGIFQQRPSVGWGSLGQVIDPTYASRAFYRRLVTVPGWEQLPLTVAAQAVQRSAHPHAYTTWEPAATRLLASLTLSGPDDISCGSDLPNGDAALPSAWPPETIGPDGLTARTRYVRDLIRSGFGETHLGGWCPGGCTTGHIPGSDHYTGHAVDIMIHPHTDPDRIADGTRLAAWLVAHADQLAIKYVIWRGHIWTAADGWHPYTHPTGSTDQTLLHMDHVHVSIQ